MTFQGKGDTRLLLKAGGGKHRLLTRWSGIWGYALVTGYQRAPTLSDTVSSLMSWTQRVIPPRKEEIMLLLALANNILLQLAREKMQLLHHLAYVVSMFIHLGPRMEKECGGRAEYTMGFPVWAGTLKGRE